ncbi:phage tail length tape measure family protein [Methylopila sp. 73B]|uniref:phage tail length tape measure family protein n=1 Tax=Methylopila sp. 73B TaxID=1120792 RepID=UPI00035C7A5C|nr:phage tail length tape measure family protein [Methylopila sp. 73B]
MVALNVVKTVTVQSKLQGVDQDTAKLREMGAATGGLSAAMPQLERQTLSAGRALDRHSAALDGSYRSSQKLAQVTQDLQRAQAQGLVTAERVNELLTMAAVRYGQAAVAATQSGHAAREAAAGWQYFSTQGLKALANDNASQRLANMGASGKTAAGGVKLAAGEVQNMSFQLNDIMVSLASGQSPFTVIMQQGMQMAQIFGPGVGVAAALKATGAAIGSFLLNPLTLTVAGLAAVASAAAYFTSSGTSGADKLSDAYERHADILRRIEDAYGKAATARERFDGGGLNVNLADARLNAAVLRAQMQSQSKTVLAGLGTDLDTGPTGTVFAVNNQFEPIRAQVEKFREEAARGKPDFDALQAAVAGLYVAAPNDSRVAKLYEDVSKLNSEGIKLQRTVELAERAAQLIDQGGARRVGTPEWDAFLSRQRGAYADEQAGRGESAARASQSYDFDLRAITARTVAQRAALAADRARADALQDSTRAHVADAEAQRASNLVYAQAVREGQEYAATLEEGVRQRVASAALEAQSAGLSVTENERLRIVMERTNQERQRAYDLTGDYNAVSAATIAQISREATALSQLGEAARLANLQRDLQDRRADLFRTPLDSQIAGMQRQAGVTPESEYGRWIDQTARMTDALQEMKEAGASAWETLGEGLRSDDGVGKSFANAGLKALDDASKKAWTNAYDNIWSSLGDSIPGLKDVGLGGKPDGSSTRPFYVVWGAGAPAAALPVAVPGNIARNALAPIANDNAAQAATAGGTNWLSYLNQGATRNQPLDPKLVKDFSFLAEKGIKMEVFSGGQPGIGEGGARVGSTRHDHGNAADVFFSQNGRRLDWNNPADVPVYQDIVRQARANGVTGFGAGPGYMQPGSMHVGYGAPGVWGAGGEGANAPGWLRSAYASPGGASAAGSTTTAALTAQSQAMAETTASIRNLNQTAAQAAPALGNVAQTAGNAGNIFGDLAQGLGGMLGMALGGKKNGAMGGMVGMLLGKVVGAGMQSGGWLSSLFGGGAGAAGGAGGGFSFFAGGGIMGPNGPIPIRAYSAGGVATSPQAAIFAEGGVPEAYVPVPSGRIPVEMNMPMPITPPPASAARVNRFGDTNITIQGSADDRVLAEFKRELDARDRAWAYQRDNAWRAA